MSLDKKLAWLLAAFAGFALVATFATIYGVRLHVEGALGSLQRSMDEAARIDRVRLAAREQYVLLREAIDGVREIDELDLYGLETKSRVRPHTPVADGPGPFPQFHL